MLVAGLGQGISVPWSELAAVVVSVVGLGLWSGSVVAQRLACSAAGAVPGWGWVRKTESRLELLSGLPMVSGLSLGLLSWWVRGMG